MSYSGDVFRLDTRGELYRGWDFFESANSQRLFRHLCRSAVRERRSTAACGEVFVSGLDPTLTDAHSGLSLLFLTLLDSNRLLDSQWPSSSTVGLIGDLIFLFLREIT